MKRYPHVLLISLDSRPRRDRTLESKYTYFRNHHYQKRHFGGVPSTGTVTADHVGS